MEEETSHHQFKHLLEEVVQELQNTDSEEGVNLDNIVSVLKNIGFFHKNLEQPANLHDFVHLAKYQLNYEIHPFGSVLLREGEYADKLFIILKGNVQRLKQRKYEDIEKEIRKKNPEAFKDAKAGKKQAPVASHHKYNPGYLQHTLATKKKTAVGRSSQFVIKTLNKLTNGDNNETKLNETIRENAVKTMNNLDISHGHKKLNRSLNEQDWEEQLGDDTMQSDEELPVPTKSMVIAKLKHNNSFKSSNFKKEQKDSPKNSNEVQDITPKSGQDSDKGKDNRIDSSQITEEDMAFLRQIVRECPDMKGRIFLSDIVRVQKGRTYKQGDYFGESFFKDTRPKEQQITAVVSEELHLLTLSRDSYFAIMEEIKIQAREKAEFFIALLPSFEEEVVKKFSYHFSERQFKKGETIYTQDEVATELLLLKTGDVRLMKDTEYALYEGTPQKRIEKTVLPVASIIQQQFFGEECLMKETNRLYTAITTSSGSTAYFIPLREYNRVKTLYEEIWLTLKNQAKERFDWRRKRVGALIEQKKQKASKIPGKITAAPKEKTETSVAMSLQLPLPKSMKKGIELGKMVKESPEFSEFRANQAYAMTVKQNKALIFEDPSVAKTHEIYKSKYSRKMRMVEKAEHEEFYLKMRGEDKRSNGTSEVVNLFKSSSKKEFLKKKNPSHLKLPSIHSPPSTQYISKSTKNANAKPSIFRGDLLATQGAHKQAKSSVLDYIATEGGDETLDATFIKEKLKNDNGLPGDMSMRLYDLKRRIEEKPSLLLTRDKAVNSLNNISEPVNYHNLNKVKVPRKFVGGFGVRKKMSEDLKYEADPEFSLVIGKMVGKDQ